jgi:DNA polymerase III alpha subunit
MINLKNRSILDDGTVICTESAAIDMLYKGQDLSDVILDDIDIIVQFNKANETLDNSFETLNSNIAPQYDSIDWFNLWVTPDEFKNIDIKQYCLSKCNTQEQQDRVIVEIQLFEERKMIPVLKNLIWLVDYFRQNKILWGCGRGSSVASYILFLIGINRIDPLKYDLDIREFLR